MQVIMRLDSHTQHVMLLNMQCHPALSNFHSGIWVTPPTPLMIVAASKLPPVFRVTECFFFSKLVNAVKKMVL